MSSQQNKSNDNQENNEANNIEEIAKEFQNEQEQNAEQDNNEVEDALQNAINEKDQQILELKDQLLRSVAELENSRKRHKSQLEDSNKYAVSKFAKDLIEVVENLYRATNSIKQEELDSNEGLKKFYDGIEMTKKDLLSTLDRHGVKRIDPVKGDEFDPNLHEAVANIPAPDTEDGCVVDAVQAGYVINDRLLRPAMVAVAKGD